MTRRTRALVIAGGLAVSVAAAVAARKSLYAPAPHVTVLHVAAGLAFITVGVVAASRRSSERVGWLTCAVGVAWFVPDLGYLPSSFAVTIAVLEATLAYAVLGHLFIAFPSGYLRSATDRAVVIAVYLWVALGNLIPDTLFAPAEIQCGGCAQNLLVFHRDPAAHTLAVNTHQIVNMAMALVVFAIVVGHWLKATPPARRILAPVAWASGPIEVAIISLNVVGVVGQFDWLTTVTPTLTPLAVMTLPLGFLAGLFGAHIAHGSVGNLIVELGHDGASTLREALAVALRDPSLQVAYWRPGALEWVDLDGRPVHLPGQTEARAATIITRGGDPTAALIHDPTLSGDPWLLDAVAAAASLALDNERLRADVTAQLEEVRASRARIVEAQDEARRRIERDLHDGAQQRLIAVLFTLQLARQDPETVAMPRMCALLDDALTRQKESLEDLRRLASGIHPAILSDGGLRPALHALAELAGVEVTVDEVPPERLPQPVEAAAYFVVSEALANVSKHACATRATVHVARDNGHLCVEVADNGVGGADLTKGSGLRGLSDRVAALDGRVEVDSPPARGTCVRAVIPCV
jgi:signal transduction histidine kinase